MVVGPILVVLFIIIFGMARLGVFDRLFKAVQNRSRRARFDKKLRIARENWPEGTADLHGHTICNEITPIGDDIFLKLTLTSSVILQPPLEIAKRSDSPLMGASLGFSGMSMDATNPALYRRILGTHPAAIHLEHHLQDLCRLCHTLNIYSNKIICLVRPAGLHHGALGALRTTLAALASTLQDIKLTRDLRLPLILHRMEQSGTPEKRITYLNLLIKYYRRRTETIAILHECERDHDFDLAFTAARALDKDLDAFIFNRIEHSDETNTLKALRRLDERTVPGTVDVLAGYYPRAASPAVRKEIISILGRRSNARARSLLVQVAQSGAPDLRRAAVSALGACGNQENLGPLYALSRDGSINQNLREWIQKAMAEIQSRCGNADEGMLSTADEADSGGLSLSEND